MASCEVEELSNMLNIIEKTRDKLGSQMVKPGAKVNLLNQIAIARAEAAGRVSTSQIFNADGKPTGRGISMMSMDERGKVNQSGTSLGPKLTAIFREIAVEKQGDNVLENTTLATGIERVQVDMGNETLGDSLPGKLLAASRVRKELGQKNMLAEERQARYDRAQKLLFQMQVAEVERLKLPPPQRQTVLTLLAEATLVGVPAAIKGKLEMSLTREVIHAGEKEIPLAQVVSGTFAPELTQTRINTLANIARKLVGKSPLGIVSLRHISTGETILGNVVERPKEKFNKIREAISAIRDLSQPELPSRSVPKYEDLLGQELIVFGTRGSWVCREK